MSAKQTSKQPLKNLIVFNLDGSGSMYSIKEGVIKLFNSQIEFLVKRSQELEQETRSFVYVFASESSNAVWDVDVLRTPNIEKLYDTGGSTALIDSTLKSIEDIKKIPQIYCDFSVLHYTISDGQNNVSAWRANELAKTIKELPDNWTLAFLAPDDAAVREAQSLGFENIQKWDATSIKGIEEVSKKITQATDSYMVARSTGVRGTKNLFNLNTDNLKSNVIKAKLQEMSAATYEMVPVRKSGVEIRDYLESYLKRPYVVGAAYYPLTKKETVQPDKNIIVMNKQDGKCFFGAAARQLLGLPDHEIKVKGDYNAAYSIYIQSRSYNRKLEAGTSVIVLK